MARVALRVGIGLAAALLALPTAAAQSGAAGAASQPAFEILTAPLPHPLAYAGSAALDASVYVFGGLRGPADGATDATSEILRFDPGDGSTSVLKLALPQPAFGTLAVADDHVIFLFGGLTRGPAGTTMSAHVLRFDARNMTLQALPVDLPVGGVWAGYYDGSDVILAGGGLGGEAGRVLAFDVHAQAVRELGRLDTPVDAWAGAARMGGDAWLLARDHSAFVHLDAAGNALAMPMAALPAAGNLTLACLGADHVVAFGEGPVAAGTGLQAIDVDLEAQAAAALASAATPVGAAAVARLGPDLYLMGGFAGGAAVQRIAHLSGAACPDAYAVDPQAGACPQPYIVGGTERAAESGQAIRFSVGVHGGSTRSYVDIERLPAHAHFDGEVLNWTPGEGDIGRTTVLTFTGYDPTAPSCARTAAANIQVFAPTRDTDIDGVQDISDDCPTVQDRDQADSDYDGVGDLCDPTPCVEDDARSQERVETPSDPCTTTAPTTQQPRVSRDDADGDGVGDGHDNCRGVYNPAQADLDNDGIGDLCDLDMDGDGIRDKASTDKAAILDNCPNLSNPDQRDSDRDGTGDACTRPVARTHATTRASVTCTGSCPGKGTGKRAPAPAGLATAALALASGLRRRARAASPAKHPPQSP